jgi:CHAT domain-containing protein
MNKININKIFYAKKGILISLFIILGFKCFSQNNILEPDSSLYFLNNPEHINCLKCRFEDSGIYFYNKAEKILAATYFEKSNSIKGDSNWTTTGLLGVINFSLGKNDLLTEKLLEKGIKLLESTGDTNNYSYAMTIEALANYYLYMKNNLVLAEKMYKLCINTKNINNFNNNLQYDFNYAALANIYSRSYRQDSALTIYRSYLNILKLPGNGLNEKNIYFFNTIFTGISSVHRTIGNSDSAIYYLGCNLSAVSNVLGENNQLFANSLSALGTLYLLNHEYEKAIDLYSKSEVIYSTLFGNTDEMYLRAELGIISAYHGLELYKKAVDKLLSLKNIIDKSPSFNQELHSECIDELILNYRSLGKLEKAENMIQEEFNTVINKYGLESYEYYNRLNIAFHFYSSFNNDKQDSILSLLELVTPKLFGENSLEIQELLTKKADYYSKIGKIDSAFNINKILINDIKNKLGKNNDYYISRLQAIGLLCMSYPIKCENLETNPLEESLSITHKLYGPSSINYYDDLRSLCRYYSIIENTLNANKFYKIAQDWLNNYIENNYFDLDNKSQMEFLLAQEDDFDELNKYIVWGKGNFDINYEICYNNELIRKGIILRNAISMKNSILNGDENSLKENLINLISINKLLQNANIYSKETDSLQKIQSELELKLNKSTKYSNIKKLYKIRWSDIKNNLPNKSIAIEFFKFKLGNDFDKNSDSDLFCYCAAILCKNFKTPKIKFIFTSDKNINNIFNRMPIKDSFNKDFLYDSSSNILSDLFLTSFDSLFQKLDINTIYLSATGILNNINLSTISIGGKLFGEKYETHLLGSTADVINYTPMYLSLKYIKKIVTLGDIDYDKSNNSLPFIKSDIGYPQISEIASRSGTSRFAYLPGTKKEIEDISKLCTQNNMPIVQYKGQNASEENFKKLNGKNEPYILHIATHGFFFADPIKSNPTTFELLQNKNNKYKLGDDPLLRSGLILSGANATWGKTDSFSTTTEDGILTSYEIANTDLSGCQLVVLSACETGLGDINASEGVFGLQRAFKMAGVKNIIMSLWKVDDNETPKLMNLFYNNCFKGESVHDALQHAQNEMKINGYAPYYWAGFKLLE